VSPENDIKDCAISRNEGKSLHELRYTAVVVNHFAEACFFSAIHRNVFEIPKKIKSFRPECLKILVKNTFRASFNTTETNDRNVSAKKKQRLKRVKSRPMTLSESRTKEI